MPMFPPVVITNGVVPSVVFAMENPEIAALEPSVNVLDSVFKTRLALEPTLKSVSMVTLLLPTAVENIPPPATLNNVFGLVVPIPTFPLPSMVSREAALPKS